MNDVKDLEAREALRRLAEFLDEELPTDEEAREECAAMGADIPALASLIAALVRAHEGGIVKEQPPPSHVRVRRARVASVGRRFRR
jgi:hypothetical protein